jgi:hypothetical protein
LIDLRLGAAMKIGFAGTMRTVRICLVGEVMGAHGALVENDLAPAGGASERAIFPHCLPCVDAALGPLDARH